MTSSTQHHSTMVDVALFTGIMSATIVLLRKSSSSKSSSSKSSSSTPSIQVSQLNIYPLKSCGEISVQVAYTTPTGFEYDRIMQVIDPNTGLYCTPRTPHYAKLFHIQPHLHIPTQLLTLTQTQTGGKNVLPPLEIDLSHARTTTPLQAQAMGNVPVQVEDLGDGASSWLQQVLEIPSSSSSSSSTATKSSSSSSTTNCRLVKIGSSYKRHVVVNPDQNEPLPHPTTTRSGSSGSKEKKDASLPSLPPVVSLADEAPYLLTTEVSLHDLNQHLRQRSQTPVDMKRFRPNIVVVSSSSGVGTSTSSTLKPWEEDTWKKIKIGQVEFWVWQRCGRCTMTTIDRQTLERGPEPLATLSTFRERSHGQRNFGVHLIPVDDDATMISSSSSSRSRRHPIQVGDTLEVLEYDEERLMEWKQLHG